MKSFYSIKDLKFDYSKSDFNFTINNAKINSGELTCILGPNGSGKSTFLKMCGGIENGFKGEIEIHNRNIKDYKRKDFAKLVSFLPQEVTSYNDYIVEDVVMMGRYPHMEHRFIPSLKDKEIAASCLKVSGVKKFLKRAFSSLSGGEKKKVLIASILAQESEFLILDEPTSSLDITSGVEIFSILKKIKNNNKGVITSTHNINLALVFADKIILLSKGKVLMEGSPKEVIKHNILSKAYGNNIEIIDHPNIEGRKIVLPKIDGGMQI